MIRIFIVAVALLAFFETGYAQTLDYPNRPIRIVVPFPPGTAAEIAARFFGQKITEMLGQPVIIDLKGGANGFIGVQAVLSAPPDGYTLFLGGHSTLVTNVALFKKLPYDPLTDFAPISMLLRSPVILLTSKSSDYQRLDQFIASAKRADGKITIGSGAAGYLLTAELFANRANFKYTNVPYKSAPDSIIGVASNQIDMAVVDITSALPMIRSGRVNALAIATEQRASGAPDIPTTEQAGVKDFLSAPWNGVMVATKVPNDIVNKLSDLFIRIIAMQNTKDFFTAQQVELMPAGQEAMRTFQKQDIQKWKQIVIDANVEQL